MDQHLSSEQRQALQIDQSLFVEAGAGSGKTEVLVARYMHLLMQYREWKPIHIVAITFTKKAAAEMLARIRYRLEQHVNQQTIHQLWAMHTIRALSYARITTIHGFCSGILQQFPSESGLSPEYHVLESDQRMYLWHRAVDCIFSELDHQKSKDLFFLFQHYTPTSIKEDLTHMFLHQDYVATWAFSEVLKKEIDSRHTHLIEDITRRLQDLFEMCLARYTLIKFAGDSVDFKDLIDRASALIKTNAYVREALKKDLFAMMVDEYQDTDATQWDLIQALALPDKNLFLVGDPKQAIYGFRGTDPALFQSVWDTWLQRSLTTQHVRLSDNYRTQEIPLHFINTLFSKVFDCEPGRLTYVPMSSKRQEKNGGSIDISQLPKHVLFEEECQAIVGWLHALPSHESVGILARTKQGFMQLQAILNKAGFASSIVDRSEKRIDVHLELFEWCKAVYDPANNLAWVAVLLSPFVGMSLDQVYLCCTQKVSSSGVLESISQTPFYSTAVTWVQWAKWMPLSRVLEKALLETGAMQHYTTSQQVERVESFLSKLRSFEAVSFESTQRILEQMEYYMDGPSYQDSSQDTSIIQLMTIHASKGLEFSSVCVADCGKAFNFSSSDRVAITKRGIGLSFKVDGLQANPHRDTLLKEHRQAVIAEEKRLFYVACTRVRDHFFLVGRHDEDKVAGLKEPRCYFDFIASIR